MVHPARPWMIVALFGCTGAAATASSGTPASVGFRPYRDSIPGTLVVFDMIPVPGGPVHYRYGDSITNTIVAPFWIGRTEVTWDEYDVFAYRLDLKPEARGGADATARPSKPYGAPDYGWGHHGYPAISIAAPAAAAYCVWLSARTGKKYRLATDAEWTRAVGTGIGPDTLLPPARLDSLAWYAGNSQARSHPVAAKAPDRLGLYDMLGNAAEWVTEGDGRAITRGGSWLYAAASVRPDTRVAPLSTWQERDPQFPKSRWWLSDGPFVGFRIVREP